MQFFCTRSKVERNKLVKIPTIKQLEFLSITVLQGLDNQGPAV